MAINRPDLQPASYNGVQFHVETDSRSSGRRVAMHEFPKREIPYAEDMGRRARRFTISAYVIGPNFQQQRNALIEQLETEGNGQLVLPTDQTFDSRTVVVENYSVSERRNQGFYAEFEITFCEAGQALGTQTTQDSQAQVSEQADQTVGAGTGTGTSYDVAQQYANGGTFGGPTGTNFSDRFGSFSPAGGSQPNLMGSTDFKGW
jgi:prophage DNA circulation protein